MGLFSRILDKLGLHKAEATPASSTPAGRTAPPTSRDPPPAGKGGQVSPGAPAKPIAPARPTAVPVTQVLAELEKKAATAGQKLNWRTSIVDLLKLLDLDSGFAARKELAVELGMPDSLLRDSAQMNTWLHQTVLRRIAENGGDIPKDVLQQH